jgi:uncharacterized protein (TIGR03790 family)
MQIWWGQKLLGGETFLGLRRFLLDHSTQWWDSNLTRNPTAALLCSSLFGAAALSAAPPLAQTVLVVYNSADSGSTAVAQYYISKRGIPSANLCAITPPATNWLNWTDFDGSVRTPIKNCLTALGSSNILYIVFTYNTPYDVIAPDTATYALDQFVADIWDQYAPPGQYGVPLIAQPYYAVAQAEGNIYSPYVSFQEFRSQNSILIYSVWRLDAATEALAQGLVDKAMAAESSGLSGQVCIDETDSTPPLDYDDGIPEWDLRMAANFSRLAGFTVLEDDNVAEFGTAPAPLRCDNAAIYSGWYRFDHYNNAFTWNTGAIGFHLDSAAAIDPRGGANWSANALINGITVTHGSVAEPYVTGWAHPDGVFRDLFQGANVGDAFVRNTLWLKWMMLNIGDPLYRPFPAGFPAVTAPPNTFALNPQYFIGGTGSTGTITLATPVASNTTFTLTSEQTSVATVPPTVTIVAGQNSASFPIQTVLVTGDSPLFITAVSGIMTLSNTLVPQAFLEGVTVSPTSVIGVGSPTGTLMLNANAPSGGLVVNLSSNSTAASPPANVVVPAGTSNVTFSIATTAVSTNTPATITASYAGASVTAGLTVTPPITNSISKVTAVNISNTGATITWTTSSSSSSEVAYGLTSAYGSTSALSTTMVTQHSVNLTGLTAQTTYHYQVLSRDSGGTLASSGDFTFTTLPGPLMLQPALVINANSTEVSGVTNGSIVTPSIAPGGFSGTVVSKGSGSVNFISAQGGNGVYFLSCCTNTNNAYFKFTGAAIGSIFNVSQGQISFNLVSRYSFAQRKTSATSARYVFDVRDGNGNHLFDFLTQVSSGMLEFSYSAAGAGAYYFVPAGTEDTVFGSGVALQVTVNWNGGVINLYLNSTLVKSVSYTAAIANWSTNSNFDLGAYEYMSFGGYNTCDDIIDAFTVSSPSGPLPLTLQAPAANAQVGAAYNSSLVAGGGTPPYTFSISSGSLPAGLTLNAGTGAITGTPTTAGTVSFTATVTDSTSPTPQTANSNASITVAPPPPLTLQPPAANGQIGVVYSSSLVASGGTPPYTFSISSGSLPSGLMLSASNGAITGTPTTVGKASFTATVTDSSLPTSQTANSSASINIAATGGPLLQINGALSELSGVTNGSIVTPSIAPGGFSGTVVSKGSGSVNFISAQGGNGVYFLSCCTNTNNAYFKFTGAAIGSIFNVSQGQISFNLVSRYSFAQRKTSAASARYAFDVRDGNGNHVFDFFTQIVSQRLVFEFVAGGVGAYYYVPAGTEDALFGNDVSLNVTLTWSGHSLLLYLNNSLAKSVPFTAVTPNWTTASIFDFGAYEYLTFGGYDSSDDVIDAFTVSMP